MTETPNPKASIRAHHWVIRSRSQFRVNRSGGQKRFAWRREERRSSRSRIAAGGGRSMRAFLSYLNSHGFGAAAQAA